MLLKDEAGLHENVTLPCKNLVVEARDHQTMIGKKYRSARKAIETAAPVTAAFNSLSLWRSLNTNV